MPKRISKKHIVLTVTVSLFLSGCATILETGAFLGFFALHSVGQVIEPIINPSYPTEYPSETALTTAVLENNEQQVADLVSKGAKIDEHVKTYYIKPKNNSDATLQATHKRYLYNPLDIAVIKDNIPIARLLLEADANVKTYLTVDLPPNIYYDTLLIHQAVINNSPAMTGLLIEHGAPVNIQLKPMIFTLLDFRYDTCLSAFTTENGRNICLQKNLQVTRLILQKPLRGKLCQSILKNKVASWDVGMADLVNSQCGMDKIDER